LVRDGRCGAIVPGVEPIQADAADELHRVIGYSTYLADVEDRHNVGVMQARRRLRLAQKAFKMIGLAQAFGRQHLQCDAPVECQVDGLINNPHAAPAELPFNPIGAELTSGT
jgi:hypothetical protein